MMREHEFDPTNAETLEQFRRIPAFSSLEESMIQEVVRMSRMRKYDPGELIIREGDYDAWVFFLIKGDLKISVKGVEVGSIRRLGDVFGEMGIIDGSPRSASIEALTPTLVVAVDASILDRQTAKDTYLVQSILYRIFCEVLAVRVRELDKRLTELTASKG
ncbi:MAG: cyclic nucleotide-binding domain-containing protein [Humidesulfovibrio sp.]|uniref:Crp/Fnr family transcriptional regulator n=1 Tax=Humidesulfovibrio sp. TaxID=2910988 RepID=UPI0027FEE182|nr:cyclic nucleotide-binding domain-containing protein [Humidesulfovibrio sp.]MDQ7835173.1 cyclic nucleotide-binding domain-containing protein [Humidesulfovibrio sp.]